VIVTRRPKYACRTAALDGIGVDLVPDHSIAPVLNRFGIRSVKGQSWTQLRIRNFRSVHQIAVYREGERAERLELIIILHEAASRLGVSKMTVVRLIRDGLLPARQVCVGDCRI
jgi:excisionase family DNA binding protein